MRKNYRLRGRVRAVPRLYELYPDICLTNEEKTRKNLSQGGRRVPVGAMKTEYTEQKTEYTELKTEYTKMKIEYTELKTEYTEMKTEYTEQKTEYTELKTEYTEQYTNRTINILGESRLRLNEEKTNSQRWPFCHFMA